LLVKMDKDFTRDRPNEAWEHYYARHLLEAFG